MFNLVARARALSALAALSVCAVAGHAAAEPVKLSEGTEMRIRIEDALTSKTAAEGDRFTITLAEPVTLANGMVLPAGYRGVGEVTDASKRGMMGKAGSLNIKFDYMKIGDQRIHLRGQKGSVGKSGVGATVTLTVLFGPLGLIKHGHNVEIKRGQEFSAFVEEDTTIDAPFAAPPPPSQT